MTVQQALVARVRRGGGALEHRLVCRPTRSEEESRAQRALRERRERERHRRVIDVVYEPDVWNSIEDADKLNREIYSAGGRRIELRRARSYTDLCVYGSSSSIYYYPGRHRGEEQQQQQQPLSSGQRQASRRGWLSAGR